ncbi:ESX secretion-associated protein EspG [Nocardia sp. NPDC051832]|uniref:ESX secretion-associated protein EspG n=1 Tax=Nocardia sp. NPDC051832 TaxID=3155673 RepID=UPI00342274E5
MSETQSVWDFTSDEFAWVWDETGIESYPYPISILETPTDGDERALLRSEIATRFPRYGDPHLSAALRVLAKPDLLVTCTGQIAGTTHRVRSVGAAIGEHAVILFQKFGTAPEFGGNLRLVATARQHLGTHIAATMPKAAAGAVLEMVGYTPRIRGEEPPTTWMVSNNGPRPAEDRIRALLRAPRSADGHLCIERHPHSERPYPREYLYWLDILPGTKAEGRYLIDVAHHTTVTPASAQDVAHALTRHIQVQD